MGLRPTKGDESRGPGMPGPYRKASFRAYAIGSGAPCTGHACVAGRSARRRVIFTGVGPIGQQPESEVLSFDEVGAETARVRVPGVEKP